MRNPITALLAAIVGGDPYDLSVPQPPTPPPIPRDPSGAAGLQREAKKRRNVRARSSKRGRAK